MDGIGLGKYGAYLCEVELNAFSASEHGAKGHEGCHVF